jgi:hypothetical protein
MTQLLPVFHKQLAVHVYSADAGAKRTMPLPTSYRSCHSPRMISPRATKVISKACTVRLIWRPCYKLHVSTLLLGSGVNGEQQAGQKHKNLGLCHGTPACPLRSLETLTWQTSLRKYMYCAQDLPWRTLRVGLDFNLLCLHMMFASLEGRSLVSRQRIASDTTDTVDTG